MEHQIMLNLLNDGKDLGYVLKFHLCDCNNASALVRGDTKVTAGP